MNYRYIVIFIGLFLAGNVLSQGYRDRVEDILLYVELEGSDNIKGSLDSLDYALSLSLENEDELVQAYVLSSLQRHVLKYFSNYEKAISYSESLKKIAENNPHIPFLKARYHSSLGLIYYYELTDKEKALKEFETALYIINSNKLEPDYYILNNYALAFMEYGKQEKAIHLLKEAAKYYESYTGFFKNPVYPFTNALNLGVAYIYQNRDSAVFYFKSALDIAKNNLKDPQQFSANVFLGVFLQEHGLVDEAIIYLEEANRSVNKNSIVTQKIVLFESFSELYIGKGDFEKAYEYLQLVSKYKDTLRLKGIEEKVIAYEYRMELDTLRSNQELKLADEKLKSVSFTKRVTLIVAILTIFILVILFLLFRINKQKELNRIKAENEALEKERIKQQAELDLMKKEEQLISANFELSVRENELTNLKDRLNAHLDKSHDPQFDDLRKFLNQIKYSEKKNEQLKNIDSVLSMSSNKFHVKLKELHPNLTESELRLLTLIRLNLSNDELLLIYNISKSSLNTKRYRVRKKIGIPSTTSLEEYIMEL